MKYLLLISLSIFCVSCSPSNRDEISYDTIEALQREQAINDWRKTLAETDECSSNLNWLAEALFVKNWHDCCYQHDFDYREGYKYGITRSEADYYLWECVEASGHYYIANLMYQAVNWFGWVNYDYSNKVIPLE